MYERTLGDYGAPYVNAEPVSNPTSEFDADKANVMFDDVAQMTRTCPRAWVEFKTNTSTNPSAADVTHDSVWGSGDAQKPVVTRTGTGRYTITWAASYIDGNGLSETVNLRFAGRPSVRDDTANQNDGKVRTLAANVVTLEVFDAAGAPSDLAGTAFVGLELR